MVYVWQHFSAIEVGYQIEAQKTQVEQMREQNRQLRLTEAQLSDPGRIDQIARQLGHGCSAAGSGGAAGWTRLYDGPVLAQASAPTAAGELIDTALGVSTSRSVKRPD